MSAFGVKRMKSLLVVAAVASVATVAAPAARAWGTGMGVYPCQTRITLQAFSQWGDDGDYFQAPNGGFDNGTWRWYTNGAFPNWNLNEPWTVFGLGSSNSLTVPFGSAPTSGKFCVTSGEEAVRLFVGRPGVDGAILHVDVLAINPVTGMSGVTPVDIDGSDPDWTPSPIITVPPLFGDNGTENLQIRIEPRGTSATWQVDDVSVDPWRNCC
jgi:hypothetical protein